MKKIASLVLFAFLLNGCDDGNLSVDIINFEDTATLSCTTNNIIYKLKEQESLLLSIPTTAFTNEPSASISTPTLINIDDSQNRVIYRAYNGKVAASNICDIIPPATPAVSEQWTASSGVIQMYITSILKVDDTDNSSRITGYNYNIVFKNITFQKPTGPQTYETFAFGDYQTTLTPPTLKYKALAEQCTDSKQIYNYDIGSSITIDNIDPALIVNEVTPVNAPRTGLINDTTNKVFYRTYNGSLSADYFCKATLPATPTVNQTWAGANGVSGVSGIIEITTTTLGNNFQHTITLKNVTLQKGNSSFRLGNSYVLGQLITIGN
ncbi:hypothetical protein OIU83_04430 [Flavobacterium sp. LS1R49]|uniref:Lipoprotein n=1 Tax=Flavobacterium shii TaxID=2987687 RepID=A0A9X2Z9M8_9FLAO|nr:hypothetical protein [Flavobacterium shii]MCV9926881.1 hypothetical protein [Flavobacterium shii]